jgi:DNA-binding LacI/PurR family transcriptional regulator
MAKRTRVTSHDVAARAGVSQPTVSLVLSGNPRARVAEATRARVLRAAEELAYRPNLLARALVQQRSFAIGVVVPTLANPFFVDVVSGLERVAVEEGYAVLLCNGRGEPVAPQVETLRGRMVDGLIIDAAGAAALPDELLTDMTVVLVEEVSERWPTVTSDAEAVGRLAAEHLLELGHRAMAMIGPATDVHALRRRERGFLSALRQAGVAVRSEWLRRAPATVRGGQEAMRALLGLGARPTAVFCANDLVAGGALKACVSARVRVPEEVSLIGCDDIEMARLTTPELTTVAVPARELGARAARLLIGMVEGDGDARARRRPLPVRLVPRGTTAAPPAPFAGGRAEGVR